MPKLLLIQNQTLRFLTQLTCLLSLLALTACGGGSSSNAAPSITSLEADLTTITIGDSVNITPVFTGGTGTTATINTIVPITSGTTFTDIPIAIGITSYTLTVTNAQGTATQTITITVNAAPTTTPTIADFTTSASFNSITAGTSINLTPVFTNGTGTITNNIDASTIAATTNVAVPVSPATNTTYTLTVSNGVDPDATSTVGVIVVAAPVILRYFQNVPGSSVPAGTVVDLAAEYTTNNVNPDRAVISDGINPDVNITSSTAGAPGDPTDPITVTVNNTTTYTLTVKNSLNFAVTATITLNVDPITASAQVLPITDTSDIVILFSSTMDTNLANLTLGGDLGGQAGTRVWSDFFGTNKLLTISPTSNWSAGIGQTLTVVAQDTLGNSTGTLTFKFDITTGTVHFVSFTAGNTKLPIRNKIALANSGDIIAVNKGTYSGPTPIVLKDGILLLGGYEEFFSERDTVQFETILEDTSATVTADATAPNSVIQAPTGVTSATVVNGFTLNGSTNAAADFTSGILMTGGANPIIENNIINGGGDPTNDTSYGIYTDSSNPTIRNNLFHGGVSSNTYGLNINSASAAFILRNNTINAGSGSLISHGIENTTATPKIENNIIFSSGGAGSNVCYSEADATAPTTMLNNYLLNCSTALYSDFGAACGGGGSSTCTLAEMEALLGGAPNAANNIDTADATFAHFVDIDGAGNIDDMTDNDWRIKVTSPAVAAGLNGIDASFGFTLDLDGVTRPDSPTLWSIGAYEPTP